MRRTLIENLKESIGKEVQISGWVDTRRDHGKLIFFVIRDRSGVVQAVITSKVPEALLTAERLRDEWVVNIIGEVKERPERMIKEDEQNGDIELSVTSIEILSEAQELPFEKDAEVNLDTLLDYRPLTMRAQRGRDILDIQSSILEAFHSFMRAQDFVEFTAPGLVPEDAEGGGEAFSVKYFDDKTAYLATSPQLYKQIMVGVHERAYTVAKIFRAERSTTTRHLSESTQMDFEMGFIKDHTDVMSMLEASTKYIVQFVLEKHKDVFDRFGISAPAISDTFPVFTLTEAQEVIEKDFGNKCVGELDLEPEHERQICEYALKEYGSDFVFITHFPTKKRAFYTYSKTLEDEESLSFDLLFRGLEINSGSQRIHNYGDLIRKMEKLDMNIKNFELYLQTFKYGMPPHGGCSTGLDRMTMKMLGLRNVREASSFPRDMNRIDTLLSKEG